MTYLIQSGEGGHTSQLHRSQVEYAGINHLQFVKLSVGYCFSTAIHPLGMESDIMCSNITAGKFYFPGASDWIFGLQLIIVCLMIL